MNCAIDPPSWPLRALGTHAVQQGARALAALAFAALLGSACTGAITSPRQAGGSSGSNPAGGSSGPTQAGGSPGPALGGAGNGGKCPPNKGRGKVRLHTQPRHLT